MMKTYQHAIAILLTAYTASPLLAQAADPGPPLPQVAADTHTGTNVGAGTSGRSGSDFNTNVDTGTSVRSGKSGTDVNTVTDTDSTLNNKGTGTDVNTNADTSTGVHKKKTMGKRRHNGDVSGRSSSNANGDVSTDTGTTLK